MKICKYVVLKQEYLQFLKMPFFWSICIDVFLLRTKLSYRYSNTGMHMIKWIHDEHEFHTSDQAAAGEKQDPEI